MIGVITLQSTSIPQLPEQYHSWPTSAKKQYLAKLQQELQARKRALAQQTYASSTSTTILLPSLHQSQREIKRDRERFNVLNCGRRFGKDILCVDLAIEIIVSGGQVGWFQPTYKSLMEVWRLVKQILRGVTPPRGVNTQDKRIEITSGGVIEFWSLDNDPEACRGREYDRVIVNEAAKVRQLQTAWELAIRATLIKGEGQRQGDAYFASTPRGRDYFWQLYQMGQVGSLTHQAGWYSVTRTSYDNLTRSRDEIALLEKSMPLTVGRQEIQALFLDVAGRFFDEWSPTRKIGVVKEGLIVEVEEEWHVVKPFPIPAHWHMWGSVDYGTSANRKTYCFELFAADPFGGVIMVDMIYLAGVQAIEQAEAVCACLMKWGRAKPVIGSGNLWQIDKTFSIIAMDWASTFPPEKVEERKGKYPVEYYWERGLPVVKAVKDRVAGWRECKQVLHDVIEVKKLDAQGQEDNDIYPKLRVFEGNCSDFIRTMPQMLTDEKNVDDLEQHDLGVDEGTGHMEDHCFVAGTLVLTDTGDRPIEDIRIGDKVLTRAGWKTATASGMTVANARVCRVKTEIGEIVGTGNHPVYVVGKGWTRIDALGYNDSILMHRSFTPCHVNEDQANTLSKWCLSAATITSGIPIVRDVATAFITEVRWRLTRLASDTFTGLFGHRFTALSPQNTMSTIAMKTPQTTPWTISNCSPVPNIVGGTCQPNVGKRQDDECRKSEPLPTYGMGPTQVKSGIANMRLKAVSVTGNASNATATTAERGTWDLSRRTFSVPTPVNRQRGERQALITYLASAWNAASSSVSTSIQTSLLVPVRVLDVSDAGRADVYNLTVDGLPEYFANGILVHNCEDTWRYAMMLRAAPSDLNAPPQAPPSKAELERQWGKVGGPQSDPTREMF